MKTPRRVNSEVCKEHNSIGCDLHKPQHALPPLDVFDCRLTQLRKLYEDSPETYAFVVRAVNAHEELLVALKNVLELAESEIRNEYDGTTLLRERLEELDFVRVAIAKAEEK